MIEIRNQTDSALNVFIPGDFSMHSSDVISPFVIENWEYACGFDELVFSLQSDV